jgi:hypothetical protein
MGQRNRSPGTPRDYMDWRSRQDESNEVHEAGRIASDVFGGQGGACHFAVPPDMAVVGAQGGPGRPAGGGGGKAQKARAPT